MLKMKYFKFIIIPIIILMIGITISCERDDICPESTSTTPKLLIDFFDFGNQENSKNVFNLLIAGVGNEFALSTFTQEDNINLPLKTVNPDTGEMSISTQYILIKDYDNNDTPDNFTDDTGNQDIITINYKPELIFVSRACGFKTIFNDVEIIIEPDNDNWILKEESANDSQPIEDETTTHFNLFH